MIEPELTFFKIQIKSGFREPSEPGQSHFSDAHEVFNSLNMGFAVYKFVVAVLNPMMLFITQVNREHSGGMDFPHNFIATHL